MGLTLYGSPLTAAGRCYLVLEEIGLPYAAVPLDPIKKETRTTEFLRLNPNGRVPCLVDGDLVLWESVAINHYLAERYRPELLGASIEERSQCLQWSVWCVTEFQGPFVKLGVQHRLAFSGVPTKTDPARLREAHEAIPRLLSILEGKLEEQRYVAADIYTIADANTATIVSLARSLNIGFSECPAIERWFGEISARAAWQKFSQLKSDAIQALRRNRH